MSLKEPSGLGDFIIIIFWIFILGIIMSLL